MSNVRKSIYGHRTMAKKRATKSTPIQAGFMGFPSGGCKSCGKEGSFCCMKIGSGELQNEVKLRPPLCRPLKHFFPCAGLARISGSAASEQASLSRPVIGEHGPHGSCRRCSSSIPSQLMHLILSCRSRRSSRKRPIWGCSNFKPAFVDSECRRIREAMSNP